jgi:hypothetical protein
MITAQPAERLRCAPAMSADHVVVVVAKVGRTGQLRHHNCMIGATTSAQWHA